MPKFCLDCGTKLKLQDTSYCENCGFKLKVSIKEEKSPEITITQKDEYEEPTKIVNLKDLGRKLEEVVAKILSNQGYETKRNQFIKTKTGLTREVDALAKKIINGKEFIMAVECKNYSNPVP